MVVSTRWGGLRVEPYRNNPKDADLDGIVQEGTIWERPAGTFIVDVIGNFIREGAPGRTLEDRGNSRIVDKDGKKVDYVPSWRKQPLSIAETKPTIGQSRGTLGDTNSTIGKTRGILNDGPSVNDDFIETLRSLDDADLDDYINRLERKERRNRLDPDKREAEWLAAARALREERDKKAVDRDEEDTGVPDVIESPQGWQETPESTKANKVTDNENQPDVTDEQTLEEVSGYNWEQKRKERKDKIKSRLQRMFNKVWKREGDDKPWLLPKPEDENGMPIDIDSDEPDQIWNAMSKAQQDEWLEKMFLVGKQIDLGLVEGDDGKKYRVVATHELGPEGFDRDDNGNPEFAGRWVFRLFDSNDNLVYNSSEGPNPTEFGNHKKAGTDRTVNISEGVLMMNYLGTDHLAEFEINGERVSAELRSLDESLAQIFNDNAFLFANQLGVTKATTQATDKGSVVWAHKGYDPFKVSYQTTQNLITSSRLVKAWEAYEALKRSGTLDMDNKDHLDIIIAASVLGDRDRYLRLKGMLSGVDIDKLPKSADEFAQLIGNSEAALDKVLAEAGVSYEELPKAQDLIYAMLPEGRLRENVLAFNLWSVNNKPLTDEELELAALQTSIPEFREAFEKRQNMPDPNTGGGSRFATNRPTLWQIVDYNTEPAIDTGQMDLTPFELDVWNQIPAPEAPQSVDPNTIHGPDRVFYTLEAGRISNIAPTRAKEKFANWTKSVLERLKKGPRKTDIAEMERFENPTFQKNSTQSLMVIAGMLERIATPDGELNNLSDDQIMLLLQIELENFKNTDINPNLSEEIAGLTVVDGRWVNYKGQNITPFISQLIADARLHERNAIEIEEAISEPIDLAQGVSGSIAVVTDNEEAKSILTKAFSFLDKYLKPTSQGNQDKRIPILGSDKFFNFYSVMSARLRDTFSQDSSDNEKPTGIGGLMSMSAITQGGNPTKKAEVDVEAFARLVQDIRNNPDLTSAQKEVAIAAQVVRLVEVGYHEYAHALDYLYDPTATPGVESGQFRPVTMKAMWALVRDLQEKGKIPAGADLREIIAKPHLFAALLTDENIKGKLTSRIGQALGVSRSDKDKLQAYRPMLMYLKELYETDTGQALLRLSSDERQGYGERIGYYGSPNEMFARFASQAFMHRTFRENGIIYNFSGLTKAERLDAELQNERILETIDPEIRILYIGFVNKHRQSNEDLSGDDEVNFSGNGELVYFSIEEVDQLSESFETALDALGALDENYVPVDPDTSIRAPLTIAGTPEAVPLASANDTEIAELVGNATRLGVAQIREKLKVLVTPRKNNLVEKGKAIENTLDIGVGNEEVPIPQSVFKKTLGTIANFMKPVIFSETDIDTGASTLQKLKVLGGNLINGSLGAFSPTKMRIAITTSTDVTMKGLREQGLTLLHEMGHAYDFQNMKTVGRMSATSAKIFNSAAFTSWLRRIKYRTGHAPNHNYTKSFDEALKEQMLSGGLAGGLQINMPLPEARDALVSAIGGVNNEFDSARVLISKVNAANLEIDVSKIRDFVGQRMMVIRNFGIMMQGWLGAASDESVEEFIQDLPEAMQPRARLLTFLSRTDSSALILNKLVNVLFGDEPDEAALNKKFQSWLTNSRFPHNLDEKRKIQRLVNLLSDPNEKDAALNELWRMFSEESVATGNQLTYLLDPSERWARAVEQSAQLKAIIELADGDADAARLLLDIIQQDEDLLRLIKASGAIPEYDLEALTLLNVIKANNPDLYDAVLLYASRYMNPLHDAIGKAKFDSSYVTDLTEAFKLLELVDDVIYSDGMSPVDEVTEAGLRRLKSTVPVPKTAFEKEIYRDNFSANFDDYVKRTYGEIKNLPISIAAEDFVELIPDGKLDAYIEAFDDDDSIIPDDADMIVSLLLAEKRRRGPNSQSLDTNDFLANDRRRGTGYLNDPNFGNLVAGGNDDVIGQSLIEGDIAGINRVDEGGRVEVFDKPVTLLASPESSSSPPPVPPIAKEQISALERVKKKVSNRRQAASKSYFDRLSKRVQSFLPSKNSSRRTTEGELVEEEKKRRKLLSEGDKGIVSWLKQFGAGRGGGVMGKAQERYQSKIKELLEGVVDRAFMKELSNFDLVDDDGNPIDQSLIDFGARKQAKRFYNQFMQHLVVAYGKATPEQIFTMIDDGDLDKEKELKALKGYIGGLSNFEIARFLASFNDSNLPSTVNNLDVRPLLEEEKARRTLDRDTPLTRLQAKRFVEAVRDKISGRRITEADTRPFLKLEGSRRAGRRLRKDLNAKLDKAIADLETAETNEEAINATREVKRITGIIDYIESFGFRGRNKNGFFSRLDDSGNEELRMEDPFHVFISDLNSNWQTSSKLPLMQIAQAELLGWNREEIIDRIFWAADEESRQEIREALEAMDNGKRVSIEHSYDFKYHVYIEDDDTKIISVKDEVRKIREQEEAFVQKYVDDKIEAATEGRVDDAYFDPMYEGGGYEDEGGGFEDELEGFEDVPLPSEEEQVAVAPRKEDLDKKIEEWKEEARIAWIKNNPQGPSMKAQGLYDEQEEKFANIERGLSRESIEAAKLGLEMQKQEVLDELKKAGVTHITLYRGVGLEDGASTPEDILRSRTSPLSSWAFSPFVAESFGDGDNLFVMEAAVPIEAIAGSSLTGFGAFHEDEVVVIADSIDPSAVVIHQGPDAIQQLANEAKAQLSDEDSTISGSKIGAVISNMDDASLVDSFTGKTISELIDEGIELGKERNEKKKIVDEVGTVIMEEDGRIAKERTDAGEVVDFNATFEASKRRLERIIQELDPEGTYDPDELAKESEFSSASVDSPASSGSLPPAPPIATEQIVPTNPTEQQQLGDVKTIAVYKADPLPEIAEKLNVDKDWSEVTVNPEKTSVVYMAYTEAEEVTKEEMTEEARVAWTALATEVEEQYEMALASVEQGGLGITIEFVDEDPYANFAEMWEDYITNKRVKVLKTEATGGHPFFTNAQNDKFRAVHDIFGHLATGRGFDRNGEEAAYQAHISMFGPDAVKAAATELRGQNSVLLETGDFPPQKLIILPEDMHKSLARWIIGILTKVLEPTRLSSEAQRQNDADNAYEITRSHHVSCGRYIA